MARAGEDAAVRARGVLALPIDLEKKPASP
jgi:hypothetical protein